MIVADLLAEDNLQLRLHTPSSSQRLGRRISWCAPTEILDPTPLLSSNVLLLTNGIGLNIEDDRTWDAYVERLARVPVAAIAFGTGTAHRLLPSGLVRAAAAHDVPLLEIPRAVPFLQVHRHVSNVLQAERFAATTRSWEIADRCAHLAASGAALGPILAEVSRAAGGPVAVLDAAGSVIARWPESSKWSRDDLQSAASDELGSSVPLPLGNGDNLHLVVRRTGSDYPLSSLLAPAASIIAMQLKGAVHTTSRKTAQLELLLSQAPDWPGVSLKEFTRTFRSTGLDPEQDTLTVVSALPPGALAETWRIRLILQERFGIVRVIVSSGVLYAFAQRADDGDREGRALARMLLERFRTEIPDRPLVLKSPSGSVDEFRLGLAQASTLVRDTAGPVIAPELSLEALVAATAGQGARVAATKLLAPVIEHDREHSAGLLRTLAIFLASDCQPSRACRALYIHRNTLSYRIRKLQTLLALRLDTLEGQSTALMALRITGHEKTGI